MNGEQRTGSALAEHLKKLCDSRFKPLFAAADLLWVASVVWFLANHHIVAGYLYVIVLGLNLTASYLIPRLFDEPFFGRLNRYYVFTRKQQHNAWQPPTLHFVPLLFPYWIDRRVLKKSRRDALQRLYRRTGERVSYGNTLTLHRVNEEEPQAEYCGAMSKSSAGGVLTFAGTVFLNVLNIRNYRHLEATRKVYQLFFNQLGRYRYTCPTD